jgi:hypothetical protein
MELKESPPRPSPEPAINTPGAPENLSKLKISGRLAQPVNCLDCPFRCEEQT